MTEHYNVGRFMRVKDLMASLFFFIIYGAAHLYTSPSLAAHINKGHGECMYFLDRFMVFNL